LEDHEDGASITACKPAAPARRRCAAMLPSAWKRRAYDAAIPSCPGRIPAVYVENSSWVGWRSILDQRCDRSPPAGVGAHWWELEPRRHRIWSDTPSAVEVQRVCPTRNEPARQDSQCVPSTTRSYRDRATHVIPFATAKGDLTPCLLRAAARHSEQQDDGGEKIGSVPGRPGLGHWCQHVRL